MKNGTIRTAVFLTIYNVGEFRVFLEAVRCSRVRVLMWNGKRTKHRCTTASLGMKHCVQKRGSCHVENVGWRGLV